MNSPEYRARAHYAAAMLHLRYLDVKDLQKSEDHLAMALNNITGSDNGIVPDVKAFLEVFLGNGLAFLRVRQGRQAEALELCQSGYQRLSDELGDHAHRLHRSVLLYNSAQVYQMLGEHSSALDFYNQAMQLDPYYSEYYNEVGNLLQAKGDFVSALSMYKKAEEYSAPYPQLHFNLGVCAANLEDWDSALKEFSRSLDLGFVDKGYPEFD